MTPSALISHVQAQTRWPASDILALVARNWPDRSTFTPTQAALVVNFIEQKEARGERA